MDYNFFFKKKGQSQHDQTIRKYFIRIYRIYLNYSTEWVETI